MTRPSATTRALLRAEDAQTEGVRLLRQIVRKHTFGWIAHKLRCDERSVRIWAREEGRPGLVLRARAEDLLGIPSSSWDEPASADVYAKDPPTARRPHR